MNQQEILKMINDELNADNIGLELNVDELNAVIIDTTRILDSRITNYINNLKSRMGIKLNSVEKENLRKKLIGYQLDNKYDTEETFIIDENDIINAYELINIGFEKNYNVMLKSIIAKSIENFLDSDINKNQEYIKYIDELQIGYHQLIILKVLGSDNLNENYLAEIINQVYENLSNYHYLIILFENDHKTVSWETIAKTAVYMENFKVEKNFNVFNRKNKEKRINELNNFIQNNQNIEYKKEFEEIINDFYEGVNYGFQFQDLFISNDGNSKILIMQKIELDESPKKCPSCHEEIVRGNSYPRLLYKSFECQNPSCSSRSKIGRGKRFDLYGAKRKSMLERSDVNDLINDEIYKAFRRDIINSNDIKIDNLITLYSWSGDNVLVINSEYSKERFKGRKINNKLLNSFTLKESNVICNLKIFKLMNSIKNSIKIRSDNKSILDKNIIKQATLLNGDSTNIIPSIKENNKEVTIGGAITSPPYYNAREYSQWDSIISYYIDMMINTHSVYDALENNGTYIYNIGDIVDIDNIYIHSNMSKRRQMLGFYSMFIFSIVGFKVDGNIIWDKGEVQSKRNSSPNHFSGYIKPINSYEHCIVFKKSNRTTDFTEIKKIEVVRKINSKGQNILGHTAPFPKEIAELIIPFIEKNTYVLEPYLGSGTTCIAMNELDINSIGIELNVDYYNLSLLRIQENSQKEKQLELL